MHWSPTDKATLIVKGKFDEKNLAKEFDQCIKNLNERKEWSTSLVKEKPSLFTVLRQGL